MEEEITKGRGDEETLLHSTTARKRPLIKEQMNLSRESQIVSGCNFSSGKEKKIHPARGPGRHLVRAVFVLLSGTVTKYSG